MKHESIPISNVELVNISPLEISPLISKCQIKVCYVSDEPNRNGSVITKEVAKKIAPSLRGAAIVGYYNEAEGDFEEHNRVIDISNGKFEVKDTTKPYGFVDLNAKVWFQKFLDDGQNEHEYLMTEGYLWTGQYEEANRIIERGNNQSMELDEKTLDATWTKNSKGGPEFFIINEAIISKLCVLGEDVEPCFEGATITNVQFSFDNGFKEQLFSMMKQLTDLLEDEGGTHQMFTTYAVEIGDSLWSAIMEYLCKTYPLDDYCSQYRIEGFYEEDGQKFSILQERKSNNYMRMNFTLSEAEGFAPVGELISVTKNFTPSATPQFALEDVEKYETEFMAAQQQNEPETEPEAKEPETDPAPAEPTIENPAEPEDPAPAAYNLEEIPEYVELQNNYAALEDKVAELQASIDSLTAENATLNEFKLGVDRNAKEDMINNTFFMLSDEDKKDVVENIDKYSLDEIEAKLSVICVRNKVNFNLDNNPSNEPDVPTIYNLDDTGIEDAATPAWVQAVLETAKNRH